MPRNLMEAAPAETFRVKPNTGRGYFEILIFNNVPLMRRHALWLMKKERRDCAPGRFWAIFLSYSDGPLLGRLLFAQTKISFGNVAHELNHAAIHWANLRKLEPMKDVDGPDSRHEELFAWAHHRMVEQFVEKHPLE